MSVITTPSSVHTVSCGRVPLETTVGAWPVSLPPTLTRSSSTPGTDRISENGSREVGMCVSSPAVKFVAVPIARRSTSGAAVVTTTVSVTDPTLSVSGSSTFRPTATTTFSRVRVAKPSMEADTV
jgi:hypothetical protein